MGGYMFKEREGDYNGIKKNNRNLWGVILAGGDGNRLKDFVSKLYGYHRPKQYCKIADSKSLLRRTFDRAQTIIPNERLVTIINRQHLKYAKEEMSEQPPGTILIQPSNKETCAGILLPLLNIYERDPFSIVALLPSDHFVYPGNRFMQYIQAASVVVDKNTDSIVMLGIVPDQPESGYGWIERGDPVLQNSGTNLYKVLKFWEKPSPQATEILFASGCYLNTFVLVGTSEAFINYISLYAPEIYKPFAKINPTLSKPAGPFNLEKMYEELPSVNFSSFVLEKIPQYLHVLEVPDVYWSDWGEEQRILRDIERFGLGSLEPQIPSNPTQHVRTIQRKYFTVTK